MKRATESFRPPIVSNFDCSHTVPMISIPQLAPVRIVAPETSVTFSFLRED